MNKTRLTITHYFTEDMRVEIESDRRQHSIVISQWIDGKAYEIELKHDHAYKLIGLMKAAMEVKL